MDKNNEKKKDSNVYTNWQTTYSKDSDGDRKLRVSWKMNGIINISDTSKGESDRYRQPTLIGTDYETERDYILEKKEKEVNYMFNHSKEGDKSYYDIYPEYVEWMKKGEKFRKNENININKKQWEEV